MSKKEMDLLWLDLETTGLDTSKCQILEVGFIRTDWTTEREKARANFLVHPSDITTPLCEMVDALKINHYTDRISGDAVLYNLPFVIAQLTEALRGARLCGANIGYDLSILRRYIPNVDAVLGDYHRIDVCSIAAPLFMSGKVASLSASRSLAKWAGLGEEPIPHVAINGADRALAIYRALLKEYGVV